MNRLLASFLFLALLATGHVQAQSLALDSVDSIVAVVDDDVILRSELERAVANIREQFASRPEQLPPQASLAKWLMNLPRRPVSRVLSRARLVRPASCRPRTTPNSRTSNTMNSLTLSANKPLA